MQCQTTVRGAPVLLGGDRRHLAPVQPRRGQAHLLDDNHPPILVPNVGFPSVSGHGSPLVRADGVCLTFMTVVFDEGWRRRPAVFAAVEGGASWTFVSFITPIGDDGAADHDRIEMADVVAFVLERDAMVIAEDADDAAVEIPGWVRPEQREVLFQLLGTRLRSARTGTTISSRRR